MGIKDFTGTISEEIGGGNGIQPMIVAAYMEKAVLDCDLMGRAYPNVSTLFRGIASYMRSGVPTRVADSSSRRPIHADVPNVSAGRDMIAPKRNGPMSMY